MEKIIVPPFVQSPDNIRCGQSVVLMILNHFLPDRIWTFEDADKLCGYTEGKWTWSEAAAVSLAEMGFDVTCYTDLNLTEFIQSPESYFLTKYGPVVGQEMIDNSDINLSVKICQRYIANTNITTLQNGWTVQDAANLLDDGYLLMTWVSSNQLYGLNGAGGGHFVTVFHYDKKSNRFLFHDPGVFSTIMGISINAAKNLAMGVDHFMNAARAGEENGSCLTAFRLSK